MDKLIARRFKILSILLWLIIATIVFRLAQLQLVHGQENRELSQARAQASLPLPAPRGEIFDRYGRPLVTNRMGFSIVLREERGLSAQQRNQQRNDIIMRVINVLRHTGDTYIDTLPLSLYAPFGFEGREESIQSALRFYNQAEDMGSVEFLEFLRDRYGIDSEDMGDVRRIAGVRFEMERRIFGAANPYTFATDVSSATVTILKEQRVDFPGVNIVVEPIREYTDGRLAAHILGRVGVIQAEDFERLRHEGYSMTAMIGIDGIERALEPYLRGIDGIEAVATMGGGFTGVSREPVAGHYGILTIDSVLQRALERSLARHIADIRTRRGGQDARGGAAVVIDVNSGEVLAMASYPTFDLEHFNRDFNRLAADPARPMFNRAIGGVYEPGSTYKVLTAVAALEEGVVRPREAIVCNGVFRAYEEFGFTISCHVWVDARVTHGPLDLVPALSVSCNYFFYEVGRRMGPRALERWGARFGLGQTTGLEIGGEAAGTLAGPESRRARGRQWFSGDTLQASIGQSDNLFTPVQLANMMATVANGGTLFEASLVRGVRSYTNSEHNIEFEPVIRQVTPMRPENFNAIMAGMREASETGTAAAIFANYPISVGSKTGTASVSRGAANAVFVAFAPIEQPEIAIAVVIEHGARGSWAAPVARDVFDQYFQLIPVEDPIMRRGVLLQ